jgi:hypothetical protein
MPEVEPVRRRACLSLAEADAVASTADAGTHDIRAGSWMRPELRCSAFSSIGFRADAAGKSVHCCERKKRTISLEALGPFTSVNDPAASPPNQV